MDLQALLIALITGAVAGWLAGILMGSSGGLIRNIILGIVGGFVGNFVLGLLHISLNGLGAILGPIVVAVIGACILIFLARLILK